MPVFNDSFPLVYTVKGRCRVCYTCLRECPVKAIKIINGQAEIITDRCIACGNCVRVCSQDAKTFARSIDRVWNLISGSRKTAAVIAPAFPAEFDELQDYRRLVGALRSLGFDYVIETAFGADIVGRQYSKLLQSNQHETIISSDCPAIVNYITYYHPELSDKLAPIDSPIMAAVKVIKRKYGEDVDIVFIGPCIAKKLELRDANEVLTFSELREMFESKGITINTCEPSEFDEPFAGNGAVFPISRGLLRNLKKPQHITESDIVVTHGHVNFREAVDEFKDGEVECRYLELLCCHGCIMGPGMTKKGRRFKKRTLITNYVREKLRRLDKQNWKKEVASYDDIDFSRTFDDFKRQEVLKLPKQEIQEVLLRMGKTKAADHLNCGACGYATCVMHAEAIIEGLAETEMCLPYTIEKLHDTVEKMEVTNKKLSSARQALKQSEKLAGMGQLSAGIAHELNNPLGVITMYSNILLEEADPNSQMYADLKLISEQANRCKNIVGGLLNFARKNQVKATECNFAEFVASSIPAIIKPENVTVSFESNMSNPKVNIDTDQMMQVLTNLEKNAVEAMPDGGELMIRVSEEGNSVILEVEDTGTGISTENMTKIFTPFFTTKEFGKGTGLGLPLIYGIIKMHMGKISVESNDNPESGPTGTKFIIRLPRNFQFTT
jgi:iron only hydrogenase large subunit-like protein/nitrogen-specific signal transduction histidine kinase